MDDDKKSKWTKVQKTLFALATGLITIICAWFINGWFDDAKDIINSEKYVAVVITDKKDATFTIPYEFRQGFGNLKRFGYNDSIKFVKYDDLLSYDQAAIIAEQLLADENCVLIIGNSTSSLTEVTLNTILSSKDSKPAFILPIATADNLIEMAKDQNYTGLLRMMPNNERQASTIKNFIFQRYSNGDIKIAILSDEENTTYSHGLSQKIADKIILDNSKGKNGKIVLKKSYGNTHRFINDFKQLKELDLLPDIIVFVGISSNGSLLMEELKNLNLSVPVIYTDGCTVKKLMEKSKHSPYNYFISAVDIELQNSDKTPTYNPVGEDARDLAINIITDLRNNVSRQSVADYVDNIRKSREQLLDNGRAGNYKFNDTGDNLEMKWRVYSYNQGRLEKVFDGD